MSDRKENLAKNTLLFALGNLGSKLLQVILIPFYTRVMTDAEFGVTDILQAVVTLLIPLFSLTIYESVFRYAMDSEYDKTRVFSTGFTVSLAGAGALLAIGGVMTVAAPVQYMWLVIANTIASSFRMLYSQYTRAINKTVLFTVDNVMLTGLVLVLNIFLIAVFHMGITGYMLGYTIANLVSTVFLAMMLKDAGRIRLKSLNKIDAKDMLRFSIPLIPNAVCWWIANFTDRIMITSMVSVAANGLYAAAHKIPSLLSVVVTIFFQAWQISANEEFKKADIGVFYSEIFSQISATIFLISSLLILLCRPITAIFLGADYQSSWVFMPPLILSMTFFSFAQFLGSIYSASKKTTMALVTNAVAIAVNVLLNFILIRRIGTIGAAIATACSYLVLWIVRTIDTRSIVEIRYDWFPVTCSAVIVTLQAILVSLDISLAAAYSISALGTLVIVFIFRKTFVSLARFALRIVNRLIKRSA